MTTEQVLEAIARERRRLIAAVDALGADATRARVTEEWTAKDVLAHCVHWVGQIAFGLGAPLEPPPWVVGVQGRPTGEEWNKRVVEHHRPLSLAEMKSEFDRYVDHLLEIAVEVADEQADAAVGFVEPAFERPGDGFAGVAVGTEREERRLRLRRSAGEGHESGGRRDEHRGRDARHGRPSHDHGCG